MNIVAASDFSDGVVPGDRLTGVCRFPTAAHLIVGGTSNPFYGKGGCVMRINIERNLHRRFRSLAAIGGDLFLLGRSQSRMALFSALTCLIVTSSIAQAATNRSQTGCGRVRAVDSRLKTGRLQGPQDDPIARTRLVEGFKKARDGDLLAAGKQLTLVDYTATLYIDSGTGREVVILQEQKVNGAYPRAWGLYVIAWPPKQNSSNLVVEVPHACPPNMPNKSEGV